VSALFITIYILPHIREKAQLLLDFFDKLWSASIEALHFYAHCLYGQPHRVAPTITDQPGKRS
jgi:hypothetical protein